jgi:hypothetical protein
MKTPNWKVIGEELTTNSPLLFLPTELGFEPLHMHEPRIQEHGVVVVEPSSWKATAISTVSEPIMMVELVADLLPVIEMRNLV